MDLMDKDNDDDSIEGQIVQNLFISSYDTDSNDDENDESDLTSNSKNRITNNENNNNSTTKQTNNNCTILDTTSTTQNQMTCETHVQICQYMHVLIEELCVGGSIAHRVWPAAEFLASFILDVHRFCQQNTRMNKERQSLREPNQTQHNETIVTIKDNVFDRRSNVESNLHNSKENDIWIEYYVKRFHRTNYQEETQTQTQNNDPSFVENIQTKRQQNKHQGCEVDSIRIAFHLLADIFNAQQKKQQQQYSEQQQQQQELINIETAHDNNTEGIQLNIQSQNHPIYILEIGAGVGLTGLELASQLCIKNISDDDYDDDDDTHPIVEKKEQSLVNVAVLLTDLETALPLLHRNIALNFDLTIQQQQHDDDDDLGCSITTTDKNDTNVCINSNIKMETPVDTALLSSVKQQQQKPIVHALKLDWSSTTDCMNALEWFQSISNKQNNTLDINNQCQQDTSLSPSSLKQQQQPQLPRQPPPSLLSPQLQPSPILIIGSDCVYWESLHEPLRCCLSTLLNNAPIGSICLLAGMRRWKRDTAFYNSINTHKTKKTNSTSTSTSSTNDNSHCNKKSKNLRCVCLYEHVQPKVKDDDQREIMRIYAIYLA